MIELRDVSKQYHTREGATRVLDHVNLQLRRGMKLGILGSNGAGKSTLIRILSGAERPSSGEVRRDMTVSWPLAFSGGFQGSLTGVDNLRFICRIYNADFRAMRPFVEDFSELGKYLREPVKTYSSGMRARLAFALSMAIEFDCYLIDEVIAVGDARFQKRCEDELFGRRADRAILMVSHTPDQITRHCDTVCVLHAGHLRVFDDVEAAYVHYGECLAHKQPVAIQPPVPEQEILA
jgi:capsular polysaccharide transport system ATP-binding protein